MAFIMSFVAVISPMLSAMPVMAAGSVSSSGMYVTYDEAYKTLALTTESTGLTLQEALDDFDTKNTTGVRAVVPSGYSIPEGAFKDSLAIERISFPNDGDLTIGASAFEGCTNLLSLVLTPAVSSLSDSSFKNCTKLASVVFPDSSMSTIPSNAFKGCIALSALNLTAGITTIASDAFAYSGVTSISGGANVTGVNNGAFFASGSTPVTTSFDSTISTALRDYNWAADNRSAVFPTVTVTFSSNGGTNVASATVNYGRTVAEPTAPTKPNYTFAGWFTDANCKNAFDFGAPVTTSITLYALWSGDEKVITFNTSGGSEIAPMSVGYGALPNAPTNPTKTGCGFTGWFTDSNLSTAYTFGSAPVTTDITLYAKWSDSSYTVTFNTGGGSAVEAQTLGYNALVTEPSSCTKTDSTLEGWYKESEFKNKWSFSSDKITANTTLYAKWVSAQIKLTFDTKGGSTIESVSVARDNAASKPTDPTKENCTFGGWYKESDCTNTYDFSTKLSADTTIYAKWTEGTPAGTSLTVTFDSVGGTQISTVTTTSGSLLAQPESPVKTGYMFGGWYKDSACTTAWNFGTDKVTTNMTLYAKWTVMTAAQQAAVNKPQTGDTTSPLFVMMSLFVGFTGGIIGGSIQLKKKES